jgi:hypothetical protein
MMSAVMVSRVAEAEIMVAEILNLQEMTIEGEILAGVRL